MRTVNSHVHVPPNFSAFADVADAVAAARAEGVAAVGISCFYDARIMNEFAAACAEAGVVGLFGLEFITLDPELETAGQPVNDPANPGRIYFCGKAVRPPAPGEAVAPFARRIREANDARAHAMLGRVAAHAAAAGVAVDLRPEGIEAAVADAAGVPSDWVSLQERHIARAVVEALTQAQADGRPDAFARVLGREPKASLDDVAGLADEVRASLLKVGRPGFVPDAPLAFADVYRHILDLGGIPTYPILGDGAPTPSSFETPPAELARRLRARGIHAAELIPLRNRSAVVDDYVAALTAVGIIVVAGTEHNTPERLSLVPAALDGPLSDAARAAFFQGLCVMAAHAARVAQGRPGFMDAEGRPTGLRDVLAAEGAAIIERSAS